MRCGGKLKSLTGTSVCVRLPVKQPPANKQSATKNPGRRQRACVWGLHNFCLKMPLSKTLSACSGHLVCLLCSCSGTQALVRQVCLKGSCGDICFENMLGTMWCIPFESRIPVSHCAFPGEAWCLFSSSSRASVSPGRLFNFVGVQGLHL